MERLDTQDEVVSKIYSSKVSCGSQGPLLRMQGKDLSLVEYSETRELATNYLVPKTISLVLPCY